MTAQAANLLDVTVQKKDIAAFVMSVVWDPHAVVGTWSLGTDSYTEPALVVVIDRIHHVVFYTRVFYLGKVRHS